jgi:hypothetical protein
MKSQRADSANGSQTHEDNRDIHRDALSTRSTSHRHANHAEMLRGSSRSSSRGSPSWPSRRPSHDRDRCPSSDNDDERHILVTPDPYQQRRQAHEAVLEKQSALHDLERLRCSGVQLSKAYSIQDDIDDIKFEIQKHAAIADEVRKVKLMKGGVQVGLRAIEWGNNKLGPFLELTGWASELTSDMGQFDEPLARIYRKYWRRSTSSPEMDMAQIIIGSAAMFHMRHKLGDIVRDMGSMNTDAPIPPTQSSQPVHVPVPNPYASAAYESKPINIESNENGFVPIQREMTIDLL